MARTIPVADTAIAQVALSALLDEIAGSTATETYNDGDASMVAELLVSSASKVQFQPSTRRLVLTYDLGMSSEDGGKAATSALVSQ